MSMILLNNTSSNINLVDSFLNILNNLGNSFNVAKTYTLTFYLDASNNQWIEGDLSITENNQLTSYKKIQQCNFTTAIIEELSVIQNFSYIIQNLTVSIDPITILFNSKKYTSNSFFQINNNKYYILTIQ
jgi:hypothetical protein